MHTDALKRVEIGRGHFAQVARVCTPHQYVKSEIAGVYRAQCSAQWKSIPCNCWSILLACPSDVQEVQSVRSLRITPAARPIRDEDTHQPAFIVRQLACTALDLTWDLDI